MSDKQVEEAAEPDQGGAQVGSPEEIDRLLEKMDREWREETDQGEQEPADGATRSSPGRPPSPETERPGALTGDQVEPAVELAWSALWRKAARAQGVDPEADPEFQRLLEQSQTGEMAEAAAPILDRLLAHLPSKYPNATQLLVAATASSFPLVMYLAEHGSGGEGDDEPQEEEPPTDDDLDAEPEAEPAEDASAPSTGGYDE